MDRSDLITGIFFVWLFCSQTIGLCQQNTPTRDSEVPYVVNNPVRDSLSRAIDNRFRHTLDSIKKTGKFKHFIVSSIMTSDTPQAGMLKKELGYEAFDGRTIDTIFFDVSAPFEEIESRNFKGWLSRTGNNLHVNTRPWILSKYLLFHSGDTLSANQLERNEFILRSQSFISNAFFVIEPIGEDRVNLILHVKDNLTIGAELDHNGTNDDSYGSIYEDNFLGLGHRLFLRSRYNLGNREFFSAADIGYTATNLFGTFFDLTGMLGTGKEYHAIVFNANKPFVTPKDYAGGVEYSNRQQDTPLSILDTTLNIAEQKMNLWFGKSFRLNSRELSLFFTVKAENYRYANPPSTNRLNNPRFHDRTTALASVGLSKEHFYKGNLIYGYGYTEDIPFGYKVEITGGYQWGKYSDIPYLGANASWGFRSRLGYYNVSISTGTFIKGIAPLERSIVNVSLFSFTNLIPFGKRYDSRIFFRTSYSTGHNLLTGELQETWFRGENKIKGLSINDRNITKLYASPEMVLFTPWSVLGFRIAPYLYFDAGTLGKSPNPFRNKFYAATGLGVRIRNQSLIFPTIQIRFSFRVKGYDNTSMTLFDLSGEQKIKAQRFNPAEPNLIELN